MNLPLSWRPSGLAAALATGGLLGLGLALVTHRPDLVAFAAPLLGGLAAGWTGPAPARSVTVRAELEPDRCFDGDQVRLRVSTEPAPGFGPQAAGWEPGGGLSRIGPPRRQLTPDGAGAGVTVCPARARRWGRWQGGLELDLEAAGGLLRASARVAAPELRIYPWPEPLQVLPRPVDLLHRIGLHRSRAVGTGVEFGGLRRYQPGDPLRTVNWLASARGHGLLVTQRLAEQACDLIAVVDTYSDIPQPGGSSLQLSVGAAAQIAQAALRRGDRAGVIVLGGLLRWLAPESPRRHFLRILDLVLDVRRNDSAVAPVLGRVPRSALPPGAAAVVFSPLLDDHVLELLRDLRERGVTVLVVDVLRTLPPPPPGRAAGPALRLWRLQRQAVRWELAGIGIDVLDWPDGAGLSEVLSPYAHRPLPGGSRAWG